MRQPAVALAALVLAGLAVAQPGGQPWAQLAGGPGHANVATLGAQPLDVLAAYDLLRSGERLNAEEGQALVDTPHGLIGIVTAGDPASCMPLWITDVAQGASRRGDAFPCARNAVLNAVVAYDPTSDAVLACTDGAYDAPMLRALDGATRAALWTLSPEEGGALPGAVGVARNWFCDGVAIDEERRVVVVPFSSIDMHVIAGVDVDTGRVVWSTVVSPEAFARQPSVLVPAPLVGFLPIIPTLTEDGIVVIANLGGAEAAVAWLDFDGRVRGAYRSAGEPGSPRSAFLSSWAAADGAAAFAILGERVVRVEPAGRGVMEGPAVVQPDETTPFSFTLYAGTAVAGDTVLLPLGSRVLVVDAREIAEEVGNWRERPDWWVQAVLATEGRDAYVLSTSRSLTEPAGSLFRFHMRGGQTVQELPLGPLTHQRNEARLLPIAAPARLLAHDFDGRFVLLGPAASELVPSLDVGEQRPAVGDAVELSLEARGDEPVRWLIAWDDGSGVAEYAPGEPIAHTYAEAGPRTVRATAVYADGRTATAEVALDVGGLRPQELNALQRAFAPERQDVTFGVLGIVIALAGGVITLARRQRHSSRLDHELALLRDIRAQGSDDPWRAMRALARYRARIEGELARGALNDAQYASLTLRASELLTALRARALAPLAHRVGPTLRLRLEAALADGVMSASEAAALRALLADDPVASARDREEIGRLLDA